MFRLNIKIIFLFLMFSTLYSQQKDTLRLELVDKKLPFGLIQKIPSNLPKIGLALSGGGARAISQLGILKAFNEQNLPIEFIIGTSMGSIIGGLYSSGYNLDELDSIVNYTRWEELFSLDQTDRNELFVDQKVTEDRAILSLRMDGLIPIIPKSLSTGQRGANFLNLLSISAPIQPQNNYDDLLYKFRAIATDLVTGKKVVLNKGPLGISMQASSSVTFLLPPLKNDSLLLVDGGLVANIPVKETKRMGADIIVAANAVSPLYQESELNYPWVIADQLISIPMHILNEQQLEEADYVIEPELNDRKNSDFSDLPRVIQKGYDATVVYLNNIETTFEEKFKDKLKIKEKFYKNLIIKDAYTEIAATLRPVFYNRDSVSNKELLYQLYLLQRTGSYSELFYEIENEEMASFLNIIAKENPNIGSYELTGNSIISAEEISTIINPLLNKPYNPLSTLKAALELLGFYRSRGYSLARIEELFFNESSNSLRIVINEGLINKIHVSTGLKTNEKIITREFPLKEGSYFNYEDAAQGLTNLRSTNLFEQIELVVNKENSKNNLTINLIEKPSNIIRFGLRIDNEYFTQATLDLRDDNFNGTGTELGAIFSGGIRNRSYILEHKANRVFDTYYTYKLRAFYEFYDVNVFKDDTTAAFNRFVRNKTEEYRQIFYGGTFGIGTQVGRFGNLFVEARLQRDQIKSKSNYTGSEYKTDISSLRISLTIDSQNDYPYPTKGFLIKTYYETAQTALGGDIGYTKIFFDYKNILGINSFHAITFRTVVGFADKTLPLSQQFSLGGQNSFFGMREYEYRGRQIFLASAEYRYKLPFRLFFDTYVKARYDLGSIWADREQIRFKDLRHGIGTTLSFKTPIGPADFSVGKAFYFKDTLLKNIVVWSPAYFYFSIGYSF